MKKVVIFILSVCAAIMFSLSIALTVKHCSNEGGNNSSPTYGDDGEWTDQY